MKLTKQTIETIKTITIVILITAVLAFVGGMRYQAHNQANIDSAVIKAVQNQPLK